MEIRSEGYIEVPGGEVWYRQLAGGTGTPLLVLHGGPGYPHDYLEPFEELSKDREIIFYDQLGCGRSDKPSDTGLFTVERYVIELDIIRKQLGLAEFHLFGHSWGTMLALDYALTWPGGIKSLIFASPCISIPRWTEDAHALRAKLPKSVQEVLNRGEQDGDYYSQEYLAASEEYSKRFILRTRPKPALAIRADNGAGAGPYTTMWGPNEFTPIGTLADYDRTHRLVDLPHPVLYTCGKFDEATPRATLWYHTLTPDSSIFIFQNSSHQAQLEEEELYLEVLGSFLNHVDSGAKAVEFDSRSFQPEKGIIDKLRNAFLR